MAVTRPSSSKTSASRTKSAKIQKFLKLARDRFQQAEDAEKQQRQRELDDLRFYAGDQWPEAIRKAREGQDTQDTTIGRPLPALPPRPCLTINKTRETVRQVLNQERQAEMGIELVPADDFGELAPPTDHREIEVREGLLRIIQRTSEASDARSWAFTRAVIAGRGYYGVMTRFLPGKTWDQEVYVQRFYNQSSVTVDPFHEQPDGSDMEWGFVGNDLPWDQYIAEHPDALDDNGDLIQNPLKNASDTEFRALGNEAPGWFSLEKEIRSVRVVDYWYLVREPRVLVELEDGSSCWEDEAPDAAKITDRRTVIEIQVKWAKIDGRQRLEETDWPSPDIPIVKVLGEELQPYDSERRAEGMVRPARDAQQGFNAMVSKWVESIGYAPIPPFQVADGQVEGYEKWYAAATTRALPYLPYRTRDLEGNQVGAPQRTNVETNIQAIAGSVGMFDQAIKSTTGVPDPNLGRQDPSVKSGKMATALIAQSQHGTSHFLDNMRRSMRREGEIENNLLYPIYGTRPGRLARIILGTGEAKVIQLGTPAGALQMGPRPVQPGATAQPQTYRLSKDAKFNVIVKVTKGYESRREEEAALLGELIGSNPQLMGVFGDLFFKALDGPGHEEMAERAKLMLAPPVQQALAAKASGQQPLPPQVQQQLAMAKQAMDKAQQEINQLQQEKAAKTVETQGKIQIAQLQETFETQRRHEDNETKLAVAELSAKVERLSLFLEERARLGTQAHEVASDAAAAAHEERLARTEHAHTVAMGAADAAHAERTQQQGHAQDLAQAQLAADLAPPTPDPSAGGQ